MHSFTELVDRCANFSIATINADTDRVVKRLQTSSETILVKQLQALTLQKHIVCVGMFSIFESILQAYLECENGFVEANKILAASGNTALKTEFYDYQCAINVLKHGTGRSYDALVAKASTLPFRVVLQDVEDPDEGDVSIVHGQIRVDDEFIRACARIINEVAAAIRQARPDVIM